MENKIDKIIRDSLKSRTIQPSGSAWERLSDQLDVIEAPKRINWFKYVGYAASVLLLISVAFFINTDDDIKPTKDETIVTGPEIDTTKFVKPNLKNTAPIQTVIVQSEKKTKNTEKVVKTTKNKSIRKRQTEIKVPSVVKENSNVVIAKNTSTTQSSTAKEKKSRIQIDSNALLNAVTGENTTIAKIDKIVIPKSSKKLLQTGRIRVDSDALLYAVTNPNKDISEYYKKYNIDRNEVLKNIQKELKKVNLTIDAKTLLTSVEKSIDEETFKNSFMQVVKGKISGLATAFSNRNN